MRIINIAVCFNDEDPTAAPFVRVTDDRRELTTVEVTPTDAWFQAFDGLAAVAGVDLGGLVGGYLAEMVANLNATIAEAETALAKRQEARDGWAAALDHVGTGKAEPAPAEP